MVTGGGSLRQLDTAPAVRRPKERGACQLALSFHSVYETTATAHGIVPSVVFPLVNPFQKPPHRHAQRFVPLVIPHFVKLIVDDTDHHNTVNQQ